MPGAPRPDLIIGKNIDLVPSLAENLLPLRADSNQLHQLLLNLCLNARDAIGKGGRLILETRNAILDAKKVHLVPGAYTLLSVSDFGKGMPKKVLKMIFEPVLTTKEVGKQTGLGLSSDYGIVQQSGCGIFVESEEGKGSTFPIYLTGLASCPKLKSPLT
ncbi:MAG: ATP-binding protein [Fibrobacterota bacterium]|nr:ATP-binding protein [Fibrobacterota bacterium]